ncbi:hypothetical protein AgCh_028363 [Apium graveolens]
MENNSVLCLLSNVAEPLFPDIDLSLSLNNVTGCSSATAHSYADLECAQSTPGSNLATPSVLQLAKTRKLSAERSEARKCNFLLNNVIDKVLFLTRMREKYLVVAAVRFVRILISRNDDHLFNHIVKNNLLKPVIDVFVDKGNRYNLLNSAVLELFEHVRRENFKILIKYIINSFWGQLVNFANFSSIHSLKVRYDQIILKQGCRFYEEGFLMRKLQKNFRWRIKFGSEILVLLWNRFGIL